MTVDSAPEFKFTVWVDGTEVEGIYADRVLPEDHNDGRTCVTFYRGEDQVARAIGKSVIWKRQTVTTRRRRTSPIR